MAPYTPYPRAPSLSPHHHGQHDDLLESLQNISSTFDLSLDRNASRTNSSPNSKPVDAALLDPEHFRRISTSSVSSVALQSRGVSPSPDAQGSNPRTWKTLFWNFWQRNQGLFLVSFSQLFGALMNVTTRLLELEGEGMQPFQILFVRQGLTMIFCTIWMWWKNIPDFPLGQKDVRLLLLGRAFSGFFGIFGMYSFTDLEIDSLQYLPVADAVVITFLAPSVASYACYIFLHEPFPKSSQYASLISLLGVLLIARPTSLFSPSGSVSYGDDGLPTNTSIPSEAPAHDFFPTPTPTQRWNAVGVAMLGVLGAAGAFTSIRWIGKRANPLISVNYFSTFCTVLSFLALTLAQPLHLSTTLAFKLPNNLRQWFMLIFLGICGFVMQFLLTKGLSCGDKRGDGRAVNMVYINMLFALALDKLIFGQSPGLWSLGGSGLILGSAIWVALQRGKGIEDREVRGMREREDGDEEEARGMLNGDDEEDERQYEDIQLREVVPPRLS